MPRRVRPKKNPYPMKKYPRMQRPRMRMAPDTSYAMRGVVDMSKMAVAGTIGAGMIGMVGSIIPHP